MAKYASWSDYESTVPSRYEEGATREAFERGLQGIAPSGMRPRPGRLDHYHLGTRGKGVVVVERWRDAMFVR